MAHYFTGIKWESGNLWLYKSDGNWVEIPLSSMMTGLSLQGMELHFEIDGNPDLVVDLESLVTAGIATWDRNSAGDVVRLALSDGETFDVDFSFLRSTDIVSASYAYPNLTLTKVNGSTIVVPIAAASVYAVYYAQSLGASSTASGTYVNKLTWTTPSLVAGTYLLEFSGIITNSGLFSSQVRFVQGSTTLATQVLSGTTKNNVGIRQVQVLSAGTQTFSVDYLTGLIGTATISDVCVTLTRIA